MSPPAGVLWGQAFREACKCELLLNCPQAGSLAGGPAGVHRRSSRSKAPSSTSRLRMTATSATLCGLPRAVRRVLTVREAGFQRIAEVAAM